MKKIELISERDLETRLHECLANRQLPDYLLYADDKGAERWLALDKAQNFTTVSRLTHLLEGNINEIVRQLPDDINVVSIGVGDGTKDKILLKALCSRGNTKYCAIDVSSKMIDATITALKELPNIDGMGVVAFAEDLPQLKKYWGTPTLFCLLGNNFCSYDPDKLLAIVESQMGPKDFFIMDCSLCSAPNGHDVQWRRQVEQEYKTEKNVIFNAGPLIERGLGQSDFKFVFDLVPTETPLGEVFRTRKQLRILKDSVLTFGKNKLKIEAGETIEMGFTYKYTHSQVAAYLWHHRLRIVQSFIGSDGSGILILSRRLMVKTEDGE